MFLRTEQLVSVINCVQHLKEWKPTMVSIPHKKKLSELFVHGRQWKDGQGAVLATSILAALKPSSFR